MFFKMTVPFLALALVSCKTYNSSYKSNLSSFTVDKFIPEDGFKDWKKAEILVLDKDGQTLKTVKVENSANSTSSPTHEMKLKYGFYKFVMKYMDSEGKLLYESCEEDATTLHELKTAVFELATRICPTDSNTPIGEVGETSVVLKPFQNPGNGGGTVEPNKTGLSGTWTRCAENSGGIAGTSMELRYQIDIDKKTLFQQNTLYHGPKCKTPEGGKEPSPVYKFEAEIIEISGEDHTFLKIKKKASKIVESIRVIQKDDVMTSLHDCFYNDDGSLKGCNIVNSVFTRVK